MGTLPPNGLSGFSICCKPFKPFKPFQPFKAL
jgi:hypothetical protein